MPEPVAARMGPSPYRGAQQPYGQNGSSANLADILERVLDKGVVIAGDIQINLLDIELLTIKLRLLVASVDKAKEMGIDWWEHDPSLSSGARGHSTRSSGPGQVRDGTREALPEPAADGTAGHGARDGGTGGHGGHEGGRGLAEENERLRAEIDRLRAAGGTPER
ncbi:gas vesicle protein [Streptomyces sp. DSM 42041]|uniref:Gas vesicle protein n=1 Tax=Streptomyces hazeniae TaxID=3075538 RepID=A0ABU2NYM6_9ACTN|nr:gas vesicle protein [Streptomyces sp. DSM 42041]MDT0382085.1 gas vesicle protein [Streptomyces sp. DSM 42041]